MHVKLARMLNRGVRNHVGRPVYLAPGQRWNSVTTNLFFLRWYCTRPPHVPSRPHSPSSPLHDAPKYLQKQEESSKKEGSIGGKGECILPATSVGGAEGGGVSRKHLEPDMKAINMNPRHNEDERRYSITAVPTNTFSASLNYYR